MTAEPPIDVADPDLYTAVDGGMGALRTLQREHPVYWNRAADSSGFWALTRYADAVTVFRSRHAFTSRYGVQVGQAGEEHLPAAGKMLVQADGADHSRIKSVISRHLTPTALQRLLPALRRATATTVRDRVDAGPFDFMTEIAAALTLAVLGGLLGVPVADRQQVLRWTAIAFGSTGPSRPASVTALDILEANASLFAYFADLLRTRRRAPSEDLIGALARPTTDPASELTDEEILFNVHLLLAGGHETTRQALAGAAASFHEHPGQWDRLRADQALLPTAVEEVLRWSAPSLNVMRTATQDIVVGGRLIREGDRVTMWNPILNRDEYAFPQAETFDVGRDPNRHLSFGMGSHFCLGAWTARQELHVLLEELGRSVRRIEIAGPVRRTRSNRTWGYDRLPIQLLA